MSREFEPLVTCEHGGNRVPGQWSHLFPEPEAEAALDSHRGWDPGALPLARFLAQGLEAPLRFSLTTRLLVDANRSPDNPELFSEFSRQASEPERSRLADRYLRRHWRKVYRTVEALHDAGTRVLHLGVHTFTPVLRGQTRSVDLGVLYDPDREPEATLAGHWLQALRQRLPDLRIMPNQPYRGAQDGLTTWLRARFSAEAYVGIELEVKQGPLVEGGGPAARLRAALLESLDRLLAS